MREEGATGVAGEGVNEMTLKGMCALSKIGYRAKRTFFSNKRLYNCKVMVSNSNLY
ncbi:MAG: hypothetical protein LKM43_04250 [Wolbachia endosymbiont of Penenirmus auritus]|nr:hypothetical protein [Wolbachia endosymbiont of Penenirmus auritus]